MTQRLASLALAATVLTIPLMAVAQSNPAGNLGSNNSETAAPNTADSPSSTLHSGDASAVPPTPSPGAQNPNIPGATGQTVVPGTSSTVSGSTQATENSKTDGATNGR